MVREYFLITFQGNFPVSRSLLGEVTDGTNQEKAFGIFGLSFGIGLVIGPVAGGWLIRPVQNYPSVFSNLGFITQYFQLFPYSFPCILVSIMNLIALCVGSYFLPNQKKKVEIKKQDEQELKEVVVSEEEQQHETSPNEITEAESDAKIEKVELITATQNTQKKSAKTCCANINKNLIMCYIIYGCNALIYTIYDQAVPLVCVKKVEDGGLNFTSFQIGFYFAIVGLTLITFQLFLYHRVAVWLGKLRTLKIGLLLALPMLLAMPQAFRVAFSPALLWITLAIIGKQFEKHINHD